jgi:3-oxoacyl-[acyl-carrier protein] reductase
MTTEGVRVALVTGAARGMGAHVARRLAEDGYELAAADVRSCDETVETIVAAGGRARGYDCDISDWDAVGQLVETIERDQGPLHAAAQVAGVYRNVPFLELDPEG